MIDPPSRPSKNRRKQLHKKAQRKLPRLLEKCNHKCHWCGVHLVLNRSFPPHLIIQAGKQWVIWNDNGEERKSFWATADHLIPVREYGNSHMSNLVAACGPCNNKRTRGFKDPHRDLPKWKGKDVCKCGGKKHPQHRRCGDCVGASKVIMKLCKITYIDNKPGSCRKCNSILIFLEEVPPHGKFYGCPTCVKSPTKLEAYLRTGQVQDQGANDVRIPASIAEEDKQEDRSSTATTSGCFTEGIVGVLQSG